MDDELRKLAEEVIEKAEKAKTKLPWDAIYVAGVGNFEYALAAANAAPRLARAVLEMSELVLAYPEWVLVNMNAEGGWAEYECPICHGSKPEHSPDCLRQRVLDATNEQED